MKSGGPSPVSGRGQTVLLFLTCLVSWDPAESFISSLACRTAWRFFLYFVLSLRLPDSRYAVTLKGSHRCFGKQTCHSMDFGLKGEPLLSVCLLKIPPAPVLRRGYHMGLFVALWWQKLDISRGNVDRQAHWRGCRPTGRATSLTRVCCPLLSELTAWVALTAPQPMPGAGSGTCCKSECSSEIRLKPLVSLKCLNNLLSRLPSTTFGTAAEAAFYLNS